MVSSEVRFCGFGRFGAHECWRVCILGVHLGRRALSLKLQSQTLDLES